MTNKAQGRIVKNTIYLYILTIAKMIFPMMTLPYLTRVFSTDMYGMVSFVKSCVSYVQIVIDFGFIWSATKEITEASTKDKSYIDRIIGDTIYAKAVLGLCSGSVLFLMSGFVPLLRENMLFSILYFVAVIISIFIPDFFFRGLERMELASMPYTIAKGISTALTLVLVHNDSTAILIPILEIISTLCAVAISMYYVKKLGYTVKVTNLRACITKICGSAIYFMSSFATTAFGALNILLVGIFMNVSDVAYWSVCNTIVVAIQSLYNPLLNSLYPHMIKKKSRKTIRTALTYFMPIITLGCVVVLIWSEPIITVVCGSEYKEAAKLFRYLTPVLFISFPSQLYGWPALGALGKAKEISKSTIIAAIVQVIGLFILIMLGKFTFVNLAFVRFISELSMFAVRYRYYAIFKSEYEQ